MTRAEARWLAALCLSLASIQMAHSSYPAALPLIREEWGLTNAAAGLIQAGYYMGYLVAVVLLLPLTDRGLETKHVWFGSLLVAALANILFPLLAQGVGLAMALRAVAGFGTVGVYMPGIRLISERFPSSRRGMPLGIYLTGFGLGSALSFGFTGVLLSTLGWQGAYMAAGALGLAGLLPALHIIRSPLTPSPPRLSSPSASLVSGLAHRPLLLAVLAYAAHNWELLGMKAWIVPFLAAALVSRGMPLATASAQGAILAFLLSLLGAGAMFFTGRLSDRYGRTAVSSAIMLLAGACSFTIGWLLVAPFWLLLAISLVYGIAAVAESPIITTAVTELALPGRLGAAQASQSFLGNVTSALAPVAFGAILDVGSWGLAFSSLGLGAVVGLGLMVGLRQCPESLALAGGRR